MICQERKIIFIHIPKTGGTSIEDMLWPQDRSMSDLWGGAKFNKYQTGGLQHLTAVQIKQEIGSAMYNSCFVFSLVRNPVDRLVSQYNYLNDRRDLRQKLKLGADRTFDEYLCKIQKAKHVQWKKQVSFLYEDGKLISEVYKLENISQNFSALATKLGHQGQNMLHRNAFCPKSNQRTSANRAELSLDNLVTIYRLFRDDFEAFGYSKPY